MGLAVIYVSKVEGMKDILRPRRFDACLSDPPYGLGFMGHAWDHGVPSAALWKIIRESMKPGAPLLAFGGTRMWHRLAVALEDAGFELRDTLMWLYGSGFPKGSDVSKGIDRRKGAKREPKRYAPRPTTSGEFTGKNTTAKWIEKGRVDGFHDSAGDQPVTQEAHRWDGYGTTLKPAWEPILLAQRDAEGTYIKSALDYGVGALNIDGCRIGVTGGCKSEEEGHDDPDAAATVFGKASGRLNSQRSPQVEGLGRWPANVLLDEEAAGMLDKQSGNRKSAKEIKRTGPTTKNAYRGGWKRLPAVGFGDEGGASRFFYIAKSSPQERGDSKHPTLKPIRLCEYLARLVLPPAWEDGVTRRLIVPFSGAGSEMLGGLRAGFEEVVGIEMSADFAVEACMRIEAEGHEVRMP